HGRLLGLTEPFLWRTVDWVVGLMRDTYPELETERRRVEETVRAEEERFAETLDTGMRLIEEYDAGHRRPGSRGVTTPLVLDGRFLFRLYDTFGFPRDLAEEIFRDKGWIATEETEATYEAEMEAQRARARAGAAFGTDEGTEAAAIDQRLAAEIPRVEFVGYDTLTAPARILAIVDAGGGGMRRVREAAEGAEVEMILDRTPAYAESGGQVGDTGTIAGRAGRGQLLDTYYRGPKLIVHRVRVVLGGFHEGEDVAVSVETPRRQGLRQHHTGTHLLHAALRRVLGTHVAQAGSLVASDHLRFDFSHGAQVERRAGDGRPEGGGAPRGGGDPQDRTARGAEAARQVARGAAGAREAVGGARGQAGALASGGADRGGAADQRRRRGHGADRRPRR